MEGYQAKGLCVLVSKGCDLLGHYADVVDIGLGLSNF